MAEESDALIVMREAGDSATMDRCRRRRLDHPEAQLHQRNPSAPGMFGPVSFVDLTGESDHVPGSQTPQPSRYLRESATFIDLIGLPDDPTQGQDEFPPILTTSNLQTPSYRPISTFQIWQTTGIFPGDLERAINRTTGSSVRRSAQQWTTVDHGMLQVTYQQPPRQPDPKPRTPSPPPTRTGFARNTCTARENDSESIFICPACGNELAYDPADTVGSEKRHFWALTCGHVYCVDCYKNRKPTQINPNGVGFRAPDGQSPYDAVAELRCAVEDCDTKVCAKDQWVGIFC